MRIFTRNWQMKVMALLLSLLLWLVLHYGYNSARPVRSASRSRPVTAVQPAVQVSTPVLP